MPPAPRQPEVGEIHVALVPRRGLEPLDRLHRLPWPDLAHVALHLAVAAPIARCPHLVEQPQGAQLRILGQASVNDPLVGIELRWTSWPRPVPRRPAVRAPVQLPRFSFPITAPPPFNGDARLPSQPQNTRQPRVQPPTASAPWARKCADLDGHICEILHGR